MRAPRLVLMILVFSLALAGDWRGFDGGFAPSLAYADDDDDDDDGPRLRIRVPIRLPARQARPATPPAPPPPPPPQYAPDEVIARGLDAQALAGLEAQGFTPLRGLLLGGGEAAHRLRKPQSLTLEEAREAVTAAGASRADLNHFYRAEQGARCSGTNCPARQMIDWPEAPAACGTPPRIGMIDTGLNGDHATLAEAALTLHRLDLDAPPSGAVHGTAVAALLVGAGDPRARGLVPHLPLVAVDAFHRTGEDERADAFALIEALDWLSAQQVRIINLSLAGPDNALLADKVAALEARGILLVAAAGNAGPRAAPAFPAAYPEVLAVTAVDRRGQVYRRAGRGAHIDLAAPGVEVWTAASISGARTKTGTSFAAPFVTAAAALILQAEPNLTPADLRHRLRTGARDLGATGRDDIFGDGLLTPPDPC